VGAVLGILLLSVATGCGGGADSGASAGSSAPTATLSSPRGSPSSPQGTQAPGSPSPPSGIPTLSSPRGSTTSTQGAEEPRSSSPLPDTTSSFLDELRAFRERCLRETTSLDAASVYYESPVRLAKSRPHRFNLEIRPATLAGGQPPGRLRKHGRILLACTVQARLLDVPGALQVAPTSWQGRRFLPPNPSRWTWVVTVRTDGRTDTVLQLKPVVQIEQGDQIEARDLGVAEYDVTFSAPAAPPAAVSLPDRVGDLLASSWKGLVALATGVSAIVAAFVAVRGLRSRNASGEGGPVSAREERSSIGSGGPSEREEDRGS
jgi:hypothetical protein